MYSRLSSLVHVSKSGSSFGLSQGSRSCTHTSSSLPRDSDSEAYSLVSDSDSTDAETKLYADRRKLIASLRSGMELIDRFSLSIYEIEARPNGELEPKRKKGLDRSQVPQCSKNPRTGYQGDRALKLLRSLSASRRSLLRRDANRAFARD